MRKLKEMDTIEEIVQQVVKRGPGRPKGSKNKPKIPAAVASKPKRADIFEVGVYNSVLKIRGVGVHSPYTSAPYNPEYSTIMVSPTGNCQLFSVATFNNVVEVCKTADDYKELFRKIKKVNGGKRLMFVDIRSNVAEKFLKKVECIGNLIHKKVPYDSTNGSKMVMLLLNLKEF